MDELWLANDFYQAIPSVERNFRKSFRVNKQQTFEFKSLMSSSKL
jgi:hypothetical protein